MNMIVWVNILVCANYYYIYENVNANGCWKFHSYVIRDLDFRRRTNVPGLLPSRPVDSQPEIAKAQAADVRQPLLFLVRKPKGFSVTYKVTLFGKKVKIKCIIYLLITNLTRHCDCIESWSVQPVLFMLHCWHT